MGIADGYWKPFIIKGIGDEHVFESESDINLISVKILVRGGNSVVLRITPKIKNAAGDIVADSDNAYDIEGRSQRDIGLLNISYPYGFKAEVVRTNDSDAISTFLILYT